MKNNNQLNKENQNPLLEAALEYRRRNWCVIPISSKTKKPLVKWKPYKKKLPTEDEIREWWTLWSNARIAILTGTISGGLVVFDIDDSNLAQKVLDFGIKTTIVKTSRGIHLYLKETKAISDFKNFRPAVEAELTANGHLFLVPPSNGYEFLSQEEILSVPNALEYVKELLSKVGISLNIETSNGVHSLNGYQVIEDGFRNDKLFRHACHLRDKGHNRGEITRIIYQMNERCCKPPKETNEVDKLIASALSYPARNPEFNSYPYITKDVRKDYKNIEELYQETPKEIDWVWQGYLAKELVTLLSGHPRARKTTLIFHLIKELLAGKDEFLNRPIKLDGNILYLTQESKSLFVTRCRAIGISMIFPRKSGHNEELVLA